MNIKNYLKDLNINTNVENNIIFNLYDDFREKIIIYDSRNGLNDMLKTYKDYIITNELYSKLNEFNMLIIGLRINLY